MGRKVIKAHYPDIFNEDCLITMSRLPDGFIDLVLTSPPYDDLRKYSGYSFEFEPIAREIYRVTARGGVVVWVVNDSIINGSRSLSSFKQSIFFKEIGFKVHDIMIYAKRNPIPQQSNRYQPTFEFMFVFTKGKPKTFNPIMVPTVNAGRVFNRISKIKKYDGDSYAISDTFMTRTIGNTKYHSNIFYYTVGNTGEEHTLHNAPFPEQLAEDQILSWSNINDMVYDPFGGSGTTAKMAYKHYRRCMTSEISREYCNVINARLVGYSKGF